MHGHGTGCTLASAIASGRCLGRSMVESCRDGVDHVHGALVHARKPGHSEVSVLDHFWRLHQQARHDWPF